MGKTTIKMILEELINVYDEDFDKFRWNVGSGFDIIKLILNGIDVADPIAMDVIKNDYNCNQHYEIYKGLERELDVSAYANPLFHEYQMREILAGLIKGVDVSIYADPKFNWSQMYQIRNGLITGVDVSIYADPKFDSTQMCEIRKGLNEGVDVSIYADPKLDAIYMFVLREGLLMSISEPVMKSIRDEMMKTL